MLGSTLGLSSREGDCPRWPSAIGIGAPTAAWPSWSPAASSPTLHSIFMLKVRAVARRRAGGARLPRTTTDGGGASEVWAKLNLVDLVVYRTGARPHGRRARVWRAARRGRCAGCGSSSARSSTAARAAGARGKKGVFIPTALVAHARAAGEPRWNARCTQMLVGVRPGDLEGPSTAALTEASPRAVDRVSRRSHEQASKCARARDRAAGARSWLERGGRWAYGRGYGKSWRTGCKTVKVAVAEISRRSRSAKARRAAPLVSGHSRAKYARRGTTRAAAGGTASRCKSAPI